ncbi:hypothetical protein AN958_07828 [Leucoagaricus sp. SymC.cos]|nr:hypothetical protein AN958_07828 [Leucoagaricus sp. SymC.cos]
MDIIPIQASSVLCERVFSSGKLMMTPHQSHISAKLMESLQIMKFSIQKGRTLNFTKGTSWEDELKEFECAAQTESTDNPETYEQTLDVDEDSDALEDELEELQWELISAIKGEGKEENDDDVDKESEGGQDADPDDNDEDDWYL